MKKIIYCFVFFIACSGNKKIHKVSTMKFDKEGHRGCRGLMPENTIPAMLYAIDLGVTTLEMDISFTKDSVAILSHEPFFNHEITTKPDGSFIEENDEKNYNIYKMNYEDVMKYDVGLKPHTRFPQQQKIAVHKPRLIDLIDAVEAYVSSKKLPKIFYNIETKTLPIADNLYHPTPSVFIDRIMKVIQEKKITERVKIQSFDFRTLQYLHQKFPNQKTAMLIEDNDQRSFDEQLKAIGFIPSIYSPAYSLVTIELIQKCHQQKMKIIPWTVNDKATIDALKKMGVDGIITDFPNLLNEK